MALIYRWWQEFIKNDNEKKKVSIPLNEKSSKKSVQKQSQIMLDTLGQVRLANKVVRSSSTAETSTVQSSKSNKQKGPAKSRN